MASDRRTGIADLTGRIVVGIAAAGCTGARTARSQVARTHIAAVDAGTVVAAESWYCRYRSCRQERFAVAVLVVAVLSLLGVVRRLGRPFEFHMRRTS